MSLGSFMDSFGGGNSGDISGSGSPLPRPAMPLAPVAPPKKQPSRYLKGFIDKFRGNPSMKDRIRKMILDEGLDPMDHGF